MCGRAMMQTVLSLTHHSLRCRPLILVMATTTTLVLLGQPSAATKCRLYHQIYHDADKAPHSIVPAVCSHGAWCVDTRYADTDPTRRHGFAKGCDHTDCASVLGNGSVIPAGWKRNGGYLCRKHRDYGNRGRVCCCNSHMCNEAEPDSAVTSSLLFTMSLLLLLLVFVGSLI